MTFKGDTNMNDIFLRKENTDYYIYVLGKNGESKPNAHLSLMFGNMKFINQSQQTIKLLTDKDGKAKLGPLKNIKYVEASATQHNIKGKWIINTTK